MYVFVISPLYFQCPAGSLLGGGVYLQCCPENEQFWYVKLSLQDANAFMIYLLYESVEPVLYQVKKGLIPRYILHQSYYKINISLSVINNSNSWVST